ncbi:uncharacterized protein LOC102572641 [Alligator mississippiensis]|uniref:uncharacterized protein LOC102572641 n=1 Tax=Alligator mississippiensis TaxID=8496 RepID=UPI002877EFDE|nr:uncharacterized protein LOC102572641 [Alligator mississippiensis]
MAAAAAALGRLRGAEKQLKNEEFVFNEETVQHLEAAIEAIKKLEEIRRRTHELLEEETIKNSNLRFRIQNLPDLITEEMTALVSAAREANAAKIHQLQTALKDVTRETELLDQKQTLYERENATLCEEQEKLWVRHEAAVDFMNQQMAKRVNTKILLSEVYKKTKNAEQDIIKKKKDVQELKEAVARERTFLQEEKDAWDKKKAEMKTKLDAQKTKSLLKKREYEHLLPKLLDIQQQITHQAAAIQKENREIAQLNEKIEQLTWLLEHKRLRGLELSKRKEDLDSDLFVLQSKISQERESLNNEIKMAEEKLHKTECMNKKLKDDNASKKNHYQLLMKEEEHLRAKLDGAAKELENLAALLDAKFEAVAKRLMDEKSLEEEIERLEDTFENMQENFGREIENLEYNLKRECEMRALLEWKRLHLTKHMEFLATTDESFLNETNEKLKVGKKRQTELIMKNKKAEKELMRTEERIKNLGEVLDKKEAEYKDYKEREIESIKVLEAEYL